MTTPPVPGPTGSGALAPGERLAHYEVRRLLGEGAMGKVYEAWDTALVRPVAVKVVHADLASDPDVASRFLEEPRAAARVVHDNLTHVYFVGTHDGRPFYAMELVEGETLEQRVGRDGPLALAAAVDLLLQAARGLHAIHRAGLVHRDVKPGNLLVTPDGRVKVTDFGLSKTLGSAGRDTAVGSLVGTPDFMSPEQCRGQAVDARTDVYALGLTTYAVLTGRRPWTGTALGAVLDQAMNAALPSVRDVRPDLPDAVDAVLARLAAKDPARRPASMAEASALLAGLAPRPVVAAPLVARATALVVDLFVYGTVAAGAAVALAGVGARLQADAAVPWLVALVALATLFVGFPLMERRFGGSVGKLLLRLEVVREDGLRPGLATLVRRFLARFPFLPIAMLPDPLLPSWLDRAAWWGTLATVLAGALAPLGFAGRTLSDRWTRTRVAYRWIDPARAR